MSLHTVFAILGLPGSKAFPAPSCKDILARKTTAVPGICLIKTAFNKLFQVYRDMETHGGGGAGPWFTATLLQITTVLPQPAMP